MSTKLKSFPLLLLVLLVGCKVAQPSGLERALAKQVKQRVTVGGKNDVNPLA